MAISFQASATPIDRATPTKPAPIERATAPTSALIVESSIARTLSTPVEVTVPAPEMNATTSTAMRFSALEPAPAAPTPMRPAPTPAAAATTIDEIDWRDVALTSMDAAVTFAPWIEA